MTILRQMCPFPRKLSLLIAVALLVPEAASAQAPADDPLETARIRFGPLGLTPSIALGNLGVDGNVFNELENPKQDFTLTLSPGLNGWFRAGRSRTSVTTRADLVYFHKYSSERSLDGEIDVRFEVAGNRLTPWVEGGYLNGRQRVGYEIDVRSRHFTTDVALGVDARLTGKTGLAFSARQTEYAFDRDAFFLGSSLQRTLGRRSESVAVAYRYARTVLTTVVIEAEARRDRFDFSSDRHADTVRIQAGFDLDERALVFGRLRIGYRKFDVLGGNVPRYTGVVASVATGFTLAGRTRVDVLGERDVAYSYSGALPYYVQTGGTLTVTQPLTNQWDVQGRTGGHRLAYRVLTSKGLNHDTEPIDRHVMVGGGIGYRVGRDMRIGLNLDRQRRRAHVYDRDYRNYGIWASVTYGR